MRKAANVQYANVDIETLLRRLRNREYNLDPDYQRQYIWSRGQKCRLIESIFLGFPIPSIFVLARREGRRTVCDVIDGVQRLSTLRDFGWSIFGTKDERNRSFALSQLKLLPELNGKRFDHLSEEDRQGFLASVIPITTITPATDGEPESVMDARDLARHLFDRANSGSPILRGERLWSQLRDDRVKAALVEIENALMDEGLERGSGDRGAKHLLALHFLYGLNAKRSPLKGDPTDRSGSRAKHDVTIFGVDSGTESRVFQNDLESRAFSFLGDPKMVPDIDGFVLNVTHYIGVAAEAFGDTLGRSAAAVSKTSPKELFFQAYIAKNTTTLPSAKSLWEASQNVEGHTTWARKCVNERLDKIDFMLAQSQSRGPT